ncbi:MAG TPA: AAA family ATPase [Candidatus Binataceae bacterium]|nr:AAA family ATPase [Candidatus Binataceae bacterium]
MADQTDHHQADQGTNAAPTVPPQPAPAHSELGAGELRGACPLSADELVQLTAAEDGDELLGQGRALDAIKLAIGIDAPGYNVFVTGLRTRAERDTVLRLLREKAALMPTPGDWVYVNNFRSPEAPVAIYLKAGQGNELRTRMNDLVGYVIDQLPKAFRREDFDQERTALREKYNKRAQELFGNFETRARERGLGIQSTPNGQVIFIPLIQGKMPESPEELQRQMQAMPEQERERLAAAQNELQGELANIVMRQQEIMHDLVADIRAIERAFAGRVITPAIEALKPFFDNPAVSAYLDDVAEHMLGHLENFRDPQETPAERPPSPFPRAESEARLQEYKVNVLVNNSGRRGAPVISEDAPTYRNLFGTIERWVDPLGRSSTNFTRIIPGSFLKAHGGFLLFDLEDAAIEPGVWATLKRTLKTGRMTPETYEPLPFFGTSGLKPEPIEVHTKLAVLGGGYLYNMLYFYDQEFSGLFKVKAEIRPVIDADRAAASRYAARIGVVVRRENLTSFDGDALRRVVEFGIRLAGDRDRIASSMEPIDDLVRESAFFAQADSAPRVTPEHVHRALVQRVMRHNFIEEEIRRLIANGTLIVHLDGHSVGQINGLAVLDVGGYAFGRPSRVTVSVALGQAGVINIEREARLSGSTHDKGVMILNGFLRGRFGQERPVAMSASVCFEQSYSGIDGDSASSTELYGLLSALSGLPIRQDFAVTGSVDQYGTVQAIGGANEKIEGFFRVCRTVGLTGRQGVMLPRSNVRNLMLDSETVQAVELGTFHIYPVETIDQGIELLTGVRAGTIDEPGTVNYLVAQRLREMSEKIRNGRQQETRVVHETASEPSAPPRPPSPPQPPR